MPQIHINAAISQQSPAILNGRLPITDDKKKIIKISLFD